MESLNDNFYEFYKEMKNEDKDIIKKILKEIKRYDVYDIIAKLSALNLVPENQNKATIIEPIVAAILTLSKDELTSKYRMSIGRFKKLIQSIEKMQLTAAIDPPENPFIDRVMFYKNYNIFTGINYIPGYILQAVINTLYISEDDALKDKSIVPLIYEGKMVDQEVSKEAIDMRLDMLTRNLTSEQKNEVMKKWSRFEKVASSEQRLELIAWDIASNYNQTLKGTGFNAMLACNKKVEAVKYYNIFKDEFPELEVAVVISSPDMREGEGSIDEDTNDIVKKFYINAISNYKNEEEYEETIKSKFINGDIDILIVVDKLLTGFDAPKASTLYLDKQIKEHNLLQAIARVNRLCDGKDYGYIVDYRGLLGELDKALTMYQEAIKSSVYYIDTEINNMFKAYEDLKELFKDIKNKNDLEEYEILLEDEKIRKDFYNKLCKFGSMLGIILPSDQAYYKVGKEKISELRKALAFYQKLRATVKLRYSEPIDHKEYEAKMQNL